MKKRHQVTIGPVTAKLVKAIAARYRKETSTDWTDVDVLESAVAHGLRMMKERLKIEGPTVAHTRE